MIKKHSDDPDVAKAAKKALKIVQTTLAKLPAATEYDYGGHEMRLGEYDMCAACTVPIAEAQQAHRAIEQAASEAADAVVKEHLELAAELLRVEAAAATIRAQLHNGHSSEPILNELLGYMHNRNIGDNYDHNHESGKCHLS